MYEARLEQLLWSMCDPPVIYKRFSITPSVYILVYSYLIDMLFVSRCPLPYDFHVCTGKTAACR